VNSTKLVVDLNKGSFIFKNQIQQYYIEYHVKAILFQLKIAILKFSKTVEKYLDMIFNGNIMRLWWITQFEGHKLKF
jgi:hypothetical protein